MKLSARQSGILSFINRTLETVARKGAIRVVCKNNDVAKALTREAKLRKIFVVTDGLNLTLANGR